MTMVGVTVVEKVKSGLILEFAIAEFTAFMDDGLDVGYKRKGSSITTECSR